MADCSCVSSTDSVLIDCRGQQQFIEGHHAHACSIAANNLFERMHELPPKDARIALLGCAKTIAIATDFFTEKGYQIVNSNVYSDAIINDLKQQKLWQKGKSHVRLWSPSPMVRYFIEQLADLADTGNHTKLGLDIACGSGRDMVFLAQQGWNMHGIDYQPEALRRSQRIAANNDVSIQCFQQDLENIAGINDKTTICELALKQLHYNGLPRQFDLISVCRYLHRPLMPFISALLKPGGIIIYQTFMQGCEKISSPKNPNFLLASGELVDSFNGFTVLKDDILHLKDGRPMSAFIAQKPV